MQVGIIYEGMKFPLWLHGHVMVEFLVASTSPKKSVGKKNTVMCSTSMSFVAYDLDAYFLVIT